ncbi:MAG: hypothetical protein KatS3mg131_3236 [Candidatus Tectimicrobiota bacterium]|nr:MAG: hypothetical protein KatS3mg131_3236 [Candidatus Tectomicrobia bacterium]
MLWMVVLGLLMLPGRLLAQEDPAANDELPRLEALAAYDQAVVKFNTHTRDFPSWAAFKDYISSRLPVGTPGKCYSLKGGARQEVDVTRVPFAGFAEDTWRKTADRGWRLRLPQRTFIECRLNEKAGQLLCLEGVKPRFFFAYTRRLCVFPLQREGAAAGRHGRLGSPQGRP